MKLRLRTILFLLFALSGFSGLIYESIWTNYLKLFLGHAAYAQTLVLAIFMGGMAIGSAISSRYSLRWKNLLLCYAVTEGIIGLLALPFHPAFAWAIDYSYATVIPHVNGAAAVNAFKWTCSALMILPQSVLLGMTFPLMSAGILRLFPDKPGGTVAMLYFTNSIGAAAGVLASGFVLIRLVGLPGTMVIAGLINIGLAVTVWSLLKKPETPGKTTGAKAIAGPGPERTRAKAKTKTPPAAKGYARTKGTAEPRVPVEKSSPVTDPALARPSWYRFFLLVSLVTGASSFIYEISWIRMLSLVLGSSTHSFELMLSAFILGLALGSLWVHRRIERVASPIRYLALVQVSMGILAISTLPLYGTTFSFMQWLVKTLAKTDSGYALFNLAGSAIAMSVMLPATVCAGMTLPLITFILIRGGHGERSIGAVYAANTIGAIIGVFFAVHAGLPLLGLKNIIACGAGLDIALGAGLCWFALAPSDNRRLPAIATVVGVVAVAAAVFLVRLDPYKMGSGVYRTGEIETLEGAKALYHKDGKTATIQCFRENDGLTTIRTNGKVDAGVMIEPGGAASPDESTMILLAAIPMSLNPRAVTAAAIGLGSGLTSHTLLGNPRLRQVDTVEIEKGVIEGANTFRPRVELVFSDPRSRIINDDAKTFFSANNKKYDLIVSEPSNPWVSGVAGLFSTEFYRLIGRHMNDDALFVQWLQLYEINVDLIVSVLKAISANFTDFAIYASNDSDIMVIARKNGQLPAPDAGVLKIPAIAEALKRIHIEGVPDIDMRWLGNKRLFSGLLEAYSMKGNSDYYPVLDQNAGRVRFLGSSAPELLNLHFAISMLSGAGQRKETANITPAPDFAFSRQTFSAMGLRDYFLNGSTGGRPVPPDLQRKAELLKHMCAGKATGDGNDRLNLEYSMSCAMNDFLTPSDMEAVWKTLAAGPCDALASPQEREWFRLFKAISTRDAVKMLEGARSLLTGGNDLTLDLRRYLLAVGMLGAISQGKKEESGRLWSEYGTAISVGSDAPSLLFRMLVAESARR